MPDLSSKTKLLIVEDKAEDVDFLQSYFGDQFSIIIAATIEKAIRILTTEKPDIVLIDLFVPSMEGKDPRGEAGEPPGVELLRMIRTNHPEIFPVVFSAYLDEITATNLIDAGAIEIIDKGASRAGALAGTLSNLSDVLKARQEALGRIGDGVRATLQDIKQNIGLARSQSSRLFRWTLAACVSGLFVFLIGAALVFSGYASSGVVLSIAGIIPEVIGGLFFKRGREENDRLDLYHRYLLENQRLLTLIDVASTIEDSSKRDEAKIDMIQTVLAQLK